MSRSFYNPSYRATIVNCLLLIVIVVCNAVVLWGLFGPRVTLQVQQVVAKEPEITKSVAKHPDGNRLVIPKLFIDVPIIEGSDESALVKGPWHIPNTGNPETGGNTVIAGHRFTYQGESVFYNFDKLAVGDEIGASWNGKAYNYKIVDIRNVQPNDMGVNSQAGPNRLTLYTCAPLWSTAQRLIVTALPSGEGK